MGNTPYLLRPMSSAEITHLCKRLNYSQVIFARVLDVSSSNLEFAQQMEAAERVMREDLDALGKLAG